MNDIENLRDTIAPKSDQLNADDLINTSKVITVTSVKRGATKEQPISIEYEDMEGRPYKPCKSMRRVLIAAWGENGTEWVGRAMKLYCDPEVKFGGVKIGGIRISHLSDIEKSMKVMLSTSRGKRAELDIQKMKSYPDVEFTEKYYGWARAVKEGKLTIEEVIQKASVTGVLTKEQIEILKGAVNDGK